MDGKFQTVEAVGQSEYGAWLVSHRRYGKLYVASDKISVINGASGKQLMQYVLDHTKAGDEVVLDLQNIASIDGRGLAMLLYLNKRLAGKKCTLSVANVSPAVRKILWITEIDRLIHVEDSGDGPVPESDPQHFSFSLNEAPAK